MTFVKCNKCFLYRLLVTFLYLTHLSADPLEILRNNIESNISNEINISNNSTESVEFKQKQSDELNAMRVQLKEQQENIQKFSSDIQSQIKVIRNATMFLITIISTKDIDCPGIRDTSSKLRILHSSLALQDPEIRLNIPDEILQSLPEGPEPEDDYNYVLPQYYDNKPTTTNYVNITGPRNTYPQSTLTTDNNTNIKMFTEEPESNHPCSNLGDGVIPSLLCVSVTENVVEITETPTRSMADFTTEIGVTEAQNSTTANNYITTDHTNITISKEDYRADDHEAGKSNKIPSALRCPDVAKRIGNECFSLHLDQNMNWTSARSFCRSLGGDLAEPNLRNDRLPKMLLKSWPSLRSSEYWTLWVGATDVEKEGEWHWVTGGILDLEASSRWDLVEPPSEGDAQDCLAMILWVPGRWRRWDLLDDSCDLKWAVFCEFSTMF